MAVISLNKVMVYGRATPAGHCREGGQGWAVGALGLIYSGRLERIVRCWYVDTYSFLTLHFLDEKIQGSPLKTEALQDRLCEWV